MAIIGVATKEISIVRRVMARSTRAVSHMPKNIMQIESDLFSSSGKKLVESPSLKDSILNRIIPFRRKFSSYIKIAEANSKRKLVFSGKTQIETTMQSMLEKLTNDQSVVQNLMNDNDFLNIAKKYLSDSEISIQELLKNTTISNTPESLLKPIIEATGVGPNKILQMLSSNEAFMSRLSNNSQSLIRSVRSKCTPTRSIAEAQNELAKVFNGKYQIKSRLGTGTIGEAYLISSNTGEEFVAKMIKKGITEEKLNTEEELMRKFIGKLAPNQKETDKYTAMLHDLYSQWRSEINFVNEARYNELLKNGAERFKVAGIQDISFVNPEKTISRAIIYKKANGIQLDTLIQMLKDYKSNPTEYAEKYQDLIKKHQWLANPNEWLKDLPDSYAMAMSEMVSTPKKGFAVVHGDPHPGNVFMDLDSKTRKLKPTFIDTGSVLVQDKKSLTESLGLMANFAVGNSKGIVRYYIDQASFIPVGYTKKELINTIAEKVDKQIFKANVNIKDLATNQKIIDNILNEFGVIIPSESTSMMKVGLQTHSVSKELANLAGTEFLIQNFMPDAVKGLGKVATFGNVKTAFNAIIDPVNHIFSDFDNSMQCCFQYFVKAA